MGRETADNRENDALPWTALRGRVSVSQILCEWCRVKVKKHMNVWVLKRNDFQLSSAEVCDTLEGRSLLPERKPEQEHLRCAVDQQRMAPVIVGPSDVRCLEHTARRLRQTTDEDVVVARKRTLFGGPCGCKRIVGVDAEEDVVVVALVHRNRLHSCVQIRVYRGGRVYVRGVCGVV